ncbi:uncharacterized protein DEA37_0001776 [Paragonimus westermani]|uniref:RING-type domain-containing protein n=1 Tax=Paragonimus westermani TaxID=34504 RepID=A0A5J4NBR2_9TREM|nr:uncharacterized protein DEA37_0001776 [Paragonimus westermani]
MDDLHRLYEHQTMMAIGIYSFLDNLLAHIPSRTDSESGSGTEVDCLPIAAIDNRAPRFRPGVSELADGLAEISRADTFRERQERIRLPPRLSTLTVSDGISRGIDPVEAGVEPTTEDVISPNNPIEPTSKAEVTPGGYPEEMFIYLSEREKEEYTCAVCYSVLKEAYQCPNEHRFCYGCIYTWSTGPSTGHDGCPVCRCDGLYAKNFDLVDRINQKRTRCIQKDCNWMGLLAEHFSHEHRRYSAYELDLLLTSSSKVASKSIGKSSQGEAVIHKPTEDHMETSEPAPSAVTLSTNVSTNPAIGTLPSTCQPLATSLEESEVMEREHQAMPQGLTHLRRDSRPSRIRTHRSASRRSTVSISGNTPLNQTPRTNILTPATPSRLSQRQSPSTHFAVPPLIRPPVAVRTSRTDTTGSTQQTDTGHRSIGNQQVRRHIRIQPRQSRSSVAPDHRPLDGASETGHARDTQSSTSRSPLPQSESRLLPFRTTPSSIFHNVALDCELDQRVSSPPPIIPTTSPASATYVAARNQMYDSRNTEVSSGTGENQIDNESDHITSISRNGNFSLPAINRNTTLTSQMGTRSYYDEVPSNENQTNDVDPDDNVYQQISARPREPRPLEFRRLVPRRQSRVVEQLRETREQLAAMLRLMTLELEERRQHVLAATLETASSSRLLRSLNSQITAHQEVRHQDNVRPTQGTSGNDSEYNPSESRDRQNHNLHNNLNVLRNLPTPGRPAQVSSSQRTLQHLTNRMLGERIHRTEAHSDAVSHSSRYRLDGSQQQTDEVENPSASPGAAMRTFGSSNPRLLARVRVDSTVSPVLLVAGRRNLDHLFVGLRYPSVTATEWSSDEDDSDEDDDDPST